MNKTAIILTTLAILFSTYYISSLDLNSQNLTLDPPKTVDYVDLTRYVGKWYEQASIPAPFQYNCQRTTAVYTMNSDDSIKVQNSCYINDQKVSVIGKATKDPADEKNSNSKLLVKFPLDSKFGHYWIVRLDDKDYSYAVVSSPDYTDLWILARQPKMSQQIFASIYKDLGQSGFSVEKLKKTIQ